MRCLPLAVAIDAEIRAGASHLAALIGYLPRSHLADVVSV